MSDQSFEAESSEIGLFTFYRRQQDDEEQRRQHKPKKKRKANRSKRKIVLQSQSNSPSLSQSPERHLANDSCDDFLKSIRSKAKKQALPEVMEHPSHYPEEDIESPREAYQSPSPLINTQQPSPHHFQGSLPIHETKMSPTINECKLSISHVEAEATRNQEFRRQRQSLSSLFRPPMRDIVKQRIRTQINHHLQHNHIDFIHSAEKQLIITRAALQKAPKETLTTAALPNRQKVNITEARKTPIRVGTERSTEGMSWQQLHEENRRYFNRLIEYVSPHRQYNQTIYRMLRETLKFPQVSQTRIENTPHHPQLLQNRSRSYSKKPLQMPLRLVPQTNNITRVKQLPSKTRLVSKSVK